MTAMTRNDINRVADFLADTLTPQQIMAVVTEALNVHNIKTTFSVTDITDPIAVTYDTTYGRQFVNAIVSFCHGLPANRTMLSGEVQACSILARQEAEHAVNVYRNSMQESLTLAPPQDDGFLDSLHYVVASQLTPDITVVDAEFTASGTPVAYLGTSRGANVT